MRRSLLSLLLGSIALNAALGIYALAVPGFGDLQRHVLLTSVCVTAGGVVALACLPAWERRRLWPVPVASVAATSLGLVLAVVLVWAEPSDGWAAVGKTMGTLFLLGGAGVISSLLALARLAPRFRWVLRVALTLIGVFALVWIGALWADWEPPTAALRTFGVLAVLLAAFVVAVPVLHRASARAPGEPLPVRFCPACGAVVTGRAGEDEACPACGAGFRVRYLETPGRAAAVETRPPGGTRAACSGQA
jgi:hypothetical protein